MSSVKKECPGVSSHDHLLNPMEREHRLIDSAQYAELSEGWDEILERIHYPVQNAVPHEGGTGSGFHMVMASFIYLTKAKLVYEIGMNVGCASVRILNALKHTDGRLRAFEIDQRKQPVADILSRRFPDTFEIVWGDSGQTLSAFPEETPDIVFIDGAHYPDVLRRDIRVALSILKSDGILFIDDVDYPSFGASLRKVILEELSDLNILWFNKESGHHPGLAIVQKQSGWASENI